MGSPRRDGRRGESDRDHRKERRRRRRRKRRRERSEENENEEGRKEGVSGKSVVESAAGENHIHCPPPNQPLVLCGSTSVGRSAAAATGGALPFSASGWLPPPPWPPSASGATVHRCQ